MHRCLDIPELLIQICAQCDNRSLATLGRTARLFDCALDTLWSGYHTPKQEIHIQDLVECFPREIRTLSRDGRPALSSPIEPQHWDRFHSYAQRVRAFDLNPDFIDRNFLSTLVSDAPPGGLLPNLTSFTFYGGHKDTLRYAHPFISPKLHTLVILCSPFSLSESPSLSIVSTLLDPLPIVCTGITRLGLDFHGTVSDHFMAALLGGLRNLHWLKLDRISAEHLPLVVTLPKLTHLRLQRVTDSPVVLPVSAPACYTLTSVDLGSSPKHILALFGLLHRCPLEYIAIRIHSLRDSAEFAHIVRMVTDKCQTHAHRSVHISHRVPDEPIYTIHATGNHDSPFLDFPNITDFHSGFFHSLFLDDTFISTLATSWPNLLSFTLATSNSETDCPPRQSRPTAKSLALMAFHCRMMHSCHLEFDGTSASLSLLEDVGKYQDGTPIQLTIQDACNPSLRILNVGYSPIADPEPVAEYLHSLFPNLFRICFSANFEVEIEAREVYLDRWRRVASLMGTEQVCGW